MYKEANKILHAAKKYIWGWPIERWPEDALQEIALIMWKSPNNFNWRELRSALDKLARKHGYVRAKLDDGTRRWMTDQEYLDHIRSSKGYRHAKGKLKRDARMKVSPERRREIARMGAKAKRGLGSAPTIKQGE